MKKLFYVALLGLLVIACGKKDDEVINDDPNGWRQKLKGDWIQYRHVIYKNHVDNNNIIYRVDTTTTSAHAYWRFTETGRLTGSSLNDMGSEGTYTIKGDSIRYTSVFDHLEFVGDSLKLEHHIWPAHLSGKHYFEAYIKVIHRINK